MADNEKNNQDKHDKRRTEDKLPKSSVAQLWGATSSYVASLKVEHLLGGLRLAGASVRVPSLDGSGSFHGK